MVRNSKLLLVGLALITLAAVGSGALVWFSVPQTSGGQNAASEQQASRAPAPGASGQNVAAPAPSTAALTPISGTATVLESAIISIDGKRIMLYGLEAIHRPQRCFIGEDRWPCYDETVNFLSAMLAEGPVTCTPVEPADYLRRELALCEVNGTSLNARYVRSGFALAFTDEMPEYAALEAAAREEKIGLWQSRFQRPTAWREDQGMSIKRP